MDSKEIKLVPTSIRLNVDLKKRVDSRIAELKYTEQATSLQEAVHDALELWLNKTSNQASATPQFQGVQNPSKPVGKESYCEESNSGSNIDLAAFTEDERAAMEILRTEGQPADFVRQIIRSYRNIIHAPSLSSGEHNRSESERSGENHKHLGAGARPTPQRNSKRSSKGVRGKG